MTPVPSFVLIAACCLLLHIALATELLVDRDGPIPRPLRQLARAPGARRSRAAAALAAAVLVGMQLLMVGSVVVPDRFAGPTGSLIAAAELLVAAVWVLYLFPRRSPDAGRL